MAIIPGSQELLNRHGYVVRRTGPLEYTAFDCETESGEDEPVCKGRDHAEATRRLIEMRLQN